MFTKEFWIVIFFIIIAIVLYVVYRRNFKILKVPNVCLITGGVKTGKSLLSVKLSTKDYKHRHRVWWFKTKILRKKDIEEPLYYTNVSISFGSLKSKKQHKLDKNIRMITTSLLLRDVRFNYGSVIYIQEASLLADNMDFNNKERNVDLSLFNKLIGHETKGGVIYYDTQSVLDCHYSIKRVASTYFFIEKNINLFLFRIVYVRELINQENGVNCFNDDVETTTRKVLVPCWYYNRYNRYEYSYLTDDLDKSDVKYERKLISFNPMYMNRSKKEKKGSEE